MRFLTLAALGLSLIAPALASPIDGSVTTNQTVPLANQAVSVTEIRPPKVDPGAWPRPVCNRQKSVFRDKTVIHIPKIQENVKTSEVCGKLWAGLKKHWQCGVTSPHSCEVSSNPEEADVEWWFHTPIVCQKTAIEAAFNWATEEKYGGKLVCIDHH